MGEHHDVAQFMIEQGALSITGIQDIAACKIQVPRIEFVQIKTFFVKDFFSNNVDKSYAGFLKL